MDGGVDGGQLARRGLLELVDEDQGADSEVDRRLAEHLEQGRQVVGEVAGVCDALHQVDIGTE